MTDQGSGYSHLPDGTRQHTYVVYHAESGEIVHGFSAIVLPYGEPEEAGEAKEAAFEQQAIEAAVDATEHDSSALRALAIQHEDLEPGVHHRIDLETERIVRHEHGGKGDSGPTGKAGS
jgi:hypothetical protein